MKKKGYFSAFFKGRHLQGSIDLCLSLIELCKEGLGFEEISKRIIKLRDEMKTYFVLSLLIH